MPGKDIPCFEFDADHPGGDYENFDSMIPDNCLEACIADPICLGFTWTSELFLANPNKCFLKSSITPVEFQEGSVSAVLVNLESQETDLQLKYNFSDLLSL